MADNSTGLTPQQQALEDAARTLFESNPGLNFGPWIMGFAFDFVLFGVMCHQLVLWLSYGHKERLFVKVLLVWAVIAATATSCFGIALMFRLFVYGFGHYANFITLDWWGWYTIFDPIVVCPVQLFYAERAYRLNDNKIWIPIIIVTLTVVSAAGDIAAKVVTSKSSLSGITTIRPYFYVWFVCMLVGDLFLTVMMVLGLRRSRTGWSNTDRLVNRLMRLSVETQLPCTLVEIAILINWSVKPDSYITFFWELFHNKTHVCAFLAVLNTQFTLRDAFESSGDTSDHKSNNYALGSARKQQATVDLDGIKVDTTIYTESQQIPTLPIGLNRQNLSDDSDMESDRTHVRWDAESQHQLAKRSDVESV
ncbi:hypothetical protein BCR39DRAFT_171859 [Naematelia encephala]|uniref:DUF6534 domain-containing protein n=1 Tax=Naematelia encephala TaxID=71784 RepID=A0A1Y2B409_9TREE|nr:hypothetical protein BCR39DRAFT_171859 [Naematelia encephala]